MAYGNKGAAMGSFVQGLNSGMQAVNSMYKNYTDTEDRVKARRARIIAGEMDERFRDDEWTKGPTQYSGGVIQGGAIPTMQQPPAGTPMPQGFGGQQGDFSLGEKGAIPPEGAMTFGGQPAPKERGPEDLFTTVMDFGNKFETAKAGGDPSNPKISLSVPRAKDWALYKKSVYDKILEKTGRSDLAEQYMDDIERRQSEGFALGATKARTYLEGGNMERAASELQKAYGFIDDGWGMVITPGEDGQSLMVYRASEDGKLVDPNSGKRVDDRILAKMGEMQRNPKKSEERVQDDYQRTTEGLLASQTAAAKWNSLSADQKNEAILAAEEDMSIMWPEIMASLPYSDRLMNDPKAQANILAAAMEWYRRNLDANKTPTLQEAIMQALSQTKYGQ